MTEELVYDRKKGLFGVKRLISGEKQKEMGSNYMVTLLDPVNFKELEDVKLNSNDYDWHKLPKDDPRVQYWKLMDIIHTADWFYSGWTENEDIVVEEAYLNEPHSVFELVRKIFGR